MGNKYRFNSNNSHEAKDNTDTIVTVSEKFNELTSTVTEAASPHATFENLKESEPNFWQKILSWRAFIILMLHFAYMMHGTTIATAPYVLVCMCGPVQTSSMITSSNTTSVFNLSGFSNVTSDVEELLLQEKRYEFSWDYKTRGLLLTSIFFTSFLAPLLANAIRGYLGNKTTLVVLTLTLAGFNFLSPVTARANVYIFLAVRVLMGLVINSHMPIAGDMMAWWLPVSEKLTAVSFVMGGWYLGGFIAPIIAGYLCALPVDGGWPLAYYFAGAVTVPWSIAIIFLTSRKPEKHPFISDKEKAYIIRTRLGLSQNSTSTQKADRPPYRSIFSSIPVISFTAAEVAHVFNVCIVLACTPTYLASVLRLSIQEAGLVMGVTWAFRFPASQLWTVLGNWLMRFESVGTNGTRKICFGLGKSIFFPTLDTCLGLIES